MPRCEYCAEDFSADMLEREHVFPKCLYPKEDRGSNVQRLTLLSCVPCNRALSDDEVHFKNVLAISGEPNITARLVWNGPTKRSFAKVDGRRRLRDLATGLVPVDGEGETRYMISPGRDPRVIRVLKKIVRGLCAYHCNLTPLDENRIFADVVPFEVPEYLLDETSFEHREMDVVQYRRTLFKTGDMHSAWLFDFYETRPFVAVVFHQPFESHAA